MEFHLSEILPALAGAHFKLNLSFVNRICCAASQSSKPSRNRKFVELLGVHFNADAKCSTTIEGWVRGHRTIPLSKLARLIELSGYSWSSVEDNLSNIKAGQHGGEIRPEFPIVADVRLGRIVGHILGDGAIDQRYSQVFFSNTNKELLDEFAEDMAAVFGVRPRIWQHKISNYENTEWDKRLLDISEKLPDRCVGLFYPTICGRILHQLLGLFACGSHKCITLQLRTAPMDFKRGLLRALFDDEASCSISSYTLRIHQKDREFLEVVRQLLNEFDIRTNDVRSYLKRGVRHHYFNVTGKRNFCLFDKHIGLTSTQKKERLVWLAQPDQRCLVTPRRLQYL